MRRSSSLTSIFPGALLSCRSESVPSNLASHRRSFLKSSMSVKELSESLDNDGLAPTGSSSRRRPRRMSMPAELGDGGASDDADAPAEAVTDDEPSPPSDGELTTTTTRRRSVSFHTVEVRSFRVCVGDNPSVLRGPPISLDWECTSTESLNFNEYESSRAPRRRSAEGDMRTTRRMREERLREEGYTARDMRKAVKEVDRIANQREETIKSLSSARGEEMMEGVAKKLKYFVTRSSEEKEMRRLWRKAQRRRGSTGEMGCSSSATLRFNPTLPVDDEFPRKPMFADEDDDNDFPLHPTKQPTDEEEGKWRRRRATASLSDDSDSSFSNDDEREEDAPPPPPLPPPPPRSGHLDVPAASRGGAPSPDPAARGEASKADESIESLFATT